MRRNLRNRFFKRLFKTLYDVTIKTSTCHAEYKFALDFITGADAAEAIDTL
jgi:hypothetical protein